MKRRSFLKGSAAAGLASTAVASPAIAQSMPELKWRLAASWPKSLDHLWGAVELFARTIGELTDNRFQIRPSAAGEIVPPLQVLDAVQAGTIEMGHSIGNYYFGKEVALAFDTGVPFGLNMRGHLCWLNHGGGIELMREVYKNYGVVTYVMGGTGAQMGGWYRKEINTVEDLNGLKFRVSGFPGRILTKLGVVPQTLAAGDVYPALERGAIDAVELVGPYDDEKLGFNKVAKYYYYPAWWEGGTSQTLYINDKAYDSLPPAYRKLVNTVADYVTQWMIGALRPDQPAGAAPAGASGTVLKPFPRPVLDACYKATLQTYDEMSAQSPAFKKIYEAWNAFRAEEQLWFRVAENSFDSFMYTQSARQ
jgi:TRAP-type mannitol/chloroaromatic compound transport system substrate-binding protein